MAALPTRVRARHATGLGSGSTSRRVPHFAPRLALGWLRRLSHAATPCPPSVAPRQLPGGAPDAVGLVGPLARLGPPPVRLASRVVTLGAAPCHPASWPGADGAGPWSAAHPVSPPRFVPSWGHAATRAWAVPRAGRHCPARRPDRPQAGLRWLPGPPAAGNALRAHRHQPPGVRFPVAPADDIVSTAAQHAAAVQPRLDLPLDPGIPALGQADRASRGDPPPPGGLSAARGPAAWLPRPSRREPCPAAAEARPVGDPWPASLSPQLILHTVDACPDLGATLPPMSPPSTAPAPPAGRGRAAAWATARRALPAGRLVPRSPPPAPRPLDPCCPRTPGSPAALTAVLRLPSGAADGRCPSTARGAPARTTGRGGPRGAPPRRARSPRHAPAPRPSGSGETPPAAGPRRAGAPAACPPSLATGAPAVPAAGVALRWLVRAAARPLVPPSGACGPVSPALPGVPWASVPHLPGRRRVPAAPPYLAPRRRPPAPLGSRRWPLALRYPAGRRPWGAGPGSRTAGSRWLSPCPSPPGPTGPARRPRWCPDHSPSRVQDGGLPPQATRRLAPHALRPLLADHTSTSVGAPPRGLPPHYPRRHTPHDCDARGFAPDRRARRWSGGACAAAALTHGVTTASGWSTSNGGRSASCRLWNRRCCDLGLPETLVAEVEWRLQAQGTLRGNIFGVMCPTGFGCRTVSELTQVRVWDTHDPGRLLGARPQQQWIRPLQRRGQALLIRLWQQVADKSPATQSRWPWTWAADDSVFKKAGQQLGLVGTWYSGQEHRVRLGIDGLLLVVVIGDGKLVVPVDFVVRRPDPVGPGRPCRDKLTWLQVMLDRSWASLQRRCRGLPPPWSWRIVGLGIRHGWNRSTRTSRGPWSWRASGGMSSRCRMGVG